MEFGVSLSFTTHSLITLHKTHTRTLDSSIRSSTSSAACCCCSASKVWRSIGRSSVMMLLINGPVEGGKEGGREGVT